MGADLKSRLAVHPRGEKRTSKTPSGGTGMQWQTKYGFVAADALELDVVVDGVNEKGLSYGILWLPEYTSYPVLQGGATESSAIDVTQLGHLLLGTCATVDEAKAVLLNATVFATNIPSFGGVPTAHATLHDAQGKSIVIEWIDGKQMVMDNPSAVLTNAPPLQWHLTNLRNYISLDPANPQPLRVGGSVLGSPGQGGGFLGIPGDWTPPSRFVRTSAMLHFARPVKDGAAGVNLPNTSSTRSTFPGRCARQTRRTRIRRLHTVGIGKGSKRR